ncbi:MAG: DNA polymerase III subunit delta [Planctomycetota bacterium]|nr:MAG: DNA polymerase III subunit delta [Planctomycetota bacterium]
MARRRARSSTGTAALELADALRGGAPAPCYVLLGGESFLEGAALAALQEVLLGENPGPSLQVFDGRKAGLAEVLDELRTVPFLGTAHRLAVVREAGGAGGFALRHGEALAAFLKGSPPATSTLVLVADKLDRRRKVTKALLAAATLVDCSPPGDEAGLLRFVRRRAEAHGAAFARGADLALLERLGGEDVSLSALDAEVHKLASAAEGGRIGVEDVLALASQGSSEQAFGLIDLLGRGDVEGSLKTLQRILRDGLVAQGGNRVRDPSGVAMILLPTLRWDLTRLLRARALLSRGRSPREVAKECRVFRDREAFLARARRADFAELRRRHTLLRRADVGLRSSADPAGTLVRVVADLALAERRR